MTPAEAEKQREEMGEMLGALLNGDTQGIISRMLVTTIAEEFMSGIKEAGYELSVGKLENGNVAIGLMDPRDGAAGPGFVLAEFSAENVQRMLAE